MTGRTRPANAIRARLAMAAMLGVVAAFLFIDQVTRPIVLWDESRNIVNALELRAQGWSLITTYAGAPDLWNTKPPLLIWAMWASAGMFGASEWALRLPSALATLATFALVMGQVRRATGALWCALLAAGLLAASPALFGEHGARTADYDALLVAFTTAYCWLGFRALTGERPRTATLLAAGGAVAGAVLTKSVAGLVPGVGLAVFAVATGRWRAVVGDRRYLVAALVAAGPVAAFLVAREAAGPGYLAAAWHNDVAGRFGSAVMGVERPWTFYLSDLAAGYFAAPLLVLAAPLAWGSLRRSERLALGHAAAVAGAVLVVASAAASKLHHYILPALPFLAIVAAIAARGLARRARAVRGTRPVVTAAVGLVFALTAYGAIRGAVVMRYLSPQVGEGARSGGYGALFAAVAVTGVGPLTVVDPGFVNEGRPGYAPVLRAYQLLAAARGQVVTRRGATPGAGPGTVGSCDPGVVARSRRIGRLVARTPGCVAVRFGG